MAGWAKSDLTKHLAAKQLHDAWMLQAISAYCLKQAKKVSKSSPHQGLFHICVELQATCFLETGNHVKLCHMTLKHLVGGGKTHQQANVDWRWLGDGEEDIVIAFIAEIADQEFPLSHAWLKEHVDSICKSHLGDKFPLGGIGQNWTYCFAQRNAEKIKITHSCPLEDKHGHAANPHTNDAWWKLLGETIVKYNIKPHNIYRSDEVGIQAQGGGKREYVFGTCKKAAPYQQHAGTQDNITAIVTICANGTTTPPATIFKGNVYQVKWGENNPLNISYITLSSIIYVAIVNPSLGLATSRKAGWMAKSVQPGWRFLKNKHTWRQMDCTGCSLLMATTHIILSPFFCSHASIKLSFSVTQHMAPIFTKVSML